MVLLIAGVSRSGKTTIAKHICRKYGLNYVPCDSIISTLEELYPETGIRHLDNNIEFSPKLAKFITSLIRHMHYEDIDAVMDTYQLFPREYHNLIAPSHIPIIYLGYPKLTAKEKLQDIRNHQRGKDWTQSIDDTEMVKILQQFISESNIMYEQCREYHIPFFDTGTSFEEASGQAIKYIEEHILHIT